LAFVTQPSGGVAGTVLAAQPAVAVEDAFGNVVTADTSQVLLTFTPGTTPLNGILSCPLNPLRAVSGIATFSRCTVNAARSGYRLRATDGGLTPADSAPFDITAGPPASVDFVAQPSRAIAGSPFAAQPVVAVEDALGNLVSTDSSAVTLTITRGTGTKGATLTCQANPLQASAGMAGFSGCAIDFPGLGYQLHASDGALAPADSEPFQVSSNIGVKLAFVTQPAGATLGAAFATQPAVAVEDAAGHVVKYDSSAITLSIRPGTGFPGATFACASNPLSATFGTARFSGCAISKAGNGYVVHATDGNLAPVDSAPFDVKAASPLDHGRSLIGQVADHPPFAIGDGPARPTRETRKTVTFTVIDSGRTQATTARTDGKGNYRIDHIPDPCAPGASQQCYVSVGDAAGTIQDSRRVYLGPDPSTTTQNLDWAHVPDRHAISGPVTHTTHGAYIKILAPAGANKAEIVLGQTKPRTCGGGPGKGGGAACVIPVAWRLEAIDPTAAQFPGQRTVQADVQLWLGVNDVDSTDITIPVDPGGPTDTPQAAAQALAGDIAVPTLDGSAQPGHGRSLIGRVADHPPFAIGEGPPRPTLETRRTVTLSVLDSSATHTTTTKTDSKGNYRIDHIPDACAPATRDECYVSVTDSAGTIQDSRRVYLGPDPSTTTQDLDWGHIPDRHAIYGPVTHTITGAYIKILAPIPGKPDMLLGQTKPRTCGGGSGKGAGPACVTPLAWRLEAIDRAQAQFPNQTEITAVVQLIEPSQRGDVPVDSTGITIPLDPGTPTNAPQTAAEIPAADIAAPALDGGTGPPVDHGRSLAGRVTDTPPFAIGDGTASKHIPQKDKTVTLTLVRGTHADTVATARTDNKGNYRIDHIPDACAPATTDECYVSVTAAGGSIQDSRRVYLGPDPSTTTQDLDWGHIPDRHAIGGTVSHTITGAYIKILAPIPGKPDQLLGQTKPRTCGSGSGKGGGPACANPLAWRLETIDPAQAQFPQQTEITAEVQLIEPSRSGDIAVDSAEVTIPLDPGTATNTPQTAAEIPAGDITAPNLQGLSVAGGSG
jgi:hypothetical protein